MDYLFIGNLIMHLGELTAYFNFPSQMMINCGIGGNTTEFIEKCLEVDCLQLKAKVTILMSGINGIQAL